MAGRNTRRGSAGTGEQAATPLPTATATDTVTSTGRSTPADALTTLQRAILDVLSARGASTADQVRQHLLPRHPLKDSSVRTLLRRLETRGLVSHTTEGKLFRYKAVMRSRQVATRAVRRLIEGFWSGSAEQFLAGLVDDNVLSVDQIERLARKVRSRK